MNSCATEHPAFRRLVSFLDSTGQWRRLLEIGDEFGPVLNDSALSAVGQQSPASTLLHVLFQQLGDCTADELAELLLSVDLTSAADLLRSDCLPQPIISAVSEPLQVQPLTLTNNCNSSGEVLVSLGSRLELFCCASGSPPLLYRWSCDSAELDGECSACIVLEPFLGAHAGRYSCAVTQCCDVSGCVDIGGAPMTISAGSVLVLPSVSAPRLLECRVDGSVWYPVVVSPENVGLQGRGEEGQGEQLSTLQKEIQGEQLLPFSQEGKQTKQLKNARTLQCVWVGWPKPRVCWKRNGVVINGKNCEILDLARLSWNMRAGQFIAVAENSQGQAVSPVFDVAAASVPVISRHPVSPHCRLAVDRTYTFTCHAFHHRPANVVWRVTVADKNRVVSPAAVHTSVYADTSLITSQLKWRVRCEDARAEHRVTCEVMDADCIELRCMSDPAIFVANYSARSKISLIIGNSRYEHLEPLHKVIEDVESFRCKIEDLGFGTLVCMNVDLRLTWRVLRYFCRVASRGCYIVVFVAGHGFTQQRVDYLVPVDARKQADGTMPPVSQCLSLERLECELQEAAPAVIVTCADICRSANLLASDACSSASEHSDSSSLNQPYTVTPSRNILRLYSAQIGEAAFDDGRFMRHLLRHIGEDVSVQELGLHTLDLEGCQAPILEISLSERRSLLDGSDCETPLDNVVHRRHLVKLADGSELYITERWNNYVCDDFGVDMRVTITLAPAGDDCGASQMSHCSVQMVVMLMCDSDTRQPLQFESSSETARVSWWRCRLSPSPSPLQLLLVLAGNGCRYGYCTPELCLSLNSMGLLKSCAITA